jgi:PAS domain S-box-containing protein
MKEEPEIIKQLREEEKIGLVGFSSELEQILPGEANKDMQEEIYSSMDNSEGIELKDDGSQDFLDNAEDYMNLILNEVSDLVLFLDLKGKIIDINKAGLKFSGFQREEIIGRYFWRIPGVFSKKNISIYIKAFKDAIRGKETKYFTASLKDKKGKKHIMTFSVFPKKINGKIKHIEVISKDITELENIKYHYDFISQNTSDLVSIVSFSINPDIIYVSPSHKERLGYDTKELIGKKFFDFINPEDKKNLSNLVKKYITSKGKKLLTGKDEKIVERFEYRLKDKEGNWHYMQTTANLADGKIIAISRDMTDEKKFEINLKESEERYRSLIENIQEGIWEIDKDGYTSFTNKKMTEIFGYTQEEMKEMHLFDFMDDKWKEIAKEKLKNREKGVHEFEFLKKNGKRAYCLLSTTPIVKNKEYAGALASLTDITEKKESEDKIKQSQESYKTIFNSSTDSIFVHDYKTGEIIDVNKAVLDKFGYKKEEIKNLNVSDLSVNKSPYTQKEAAEWIKKATEEGPQKFEWCSKTKNGEILWHENILQKVNIGGEERVLVIGRDITDRKRQNKELREKEEIFRKIVETVPSMLLITDKKGLPVYISPNSKDFTGYSPDDFYKEIKWWAHHDDREEAKRLFKDAFTNHNAGNFSYKAIKKNGDFWYASSSWVPLKNQKGEFDGIVMQTTDITEKNEAEKSLKESEKRLKKAQEIAKLGNWEWDIKNSKIWWSDGLYDIFGVKKDNFVLSYDDISKLIHPDDGEINQKRVDKLLKEGYIEPYEQRIITPGGEIKWINQIIEYTKDASGELLICKGTIQDITYLKEREIKLKESEERHRVLLEASKDSIYVLDYDFKHILVNESATKFTGKTKEELIGKRLQDVFPGVEETPFFKTFEKVMKTREFDSVLNVYEFEDGRKCYYEVNVTPVPEGILCISRDITKRKEVEEELEKSEKQKSIILNSTKELFSYYNTDLEILWVNKSSADSVGKKPEDMIGKHCYEFWNQSNKPCNDCPVLKSYKTGKPEEIEKQTPDGRYWQIRGYPIFDKTGKISNLVELSRDITEKKKAEDEIRKSEEKYRELFNNALVGIDIHNSDGSVFAVNKTAEKIFGLPEEELKKKDLSFWKGKLIKPDETEMEPKDFPLSIVAETKKPSEGIIIGLKMSEKESTRWFLHSARPILDEKREIDKIVTSFVEITSQKEAEKKKEETLEENQFLSRSLIRISKSKNVDEICNDIGKELYEYCGPSIVAVNLYDKKENVFFNRAIYGVEESGKIAKILGREISKIKVKVPKEIHEEVKKGAILELKEGLYEALFGTLPKPVCKTVESVLKIKDMFVVPLYHDKKLFGVLMIFTKKEGKEIRSSFLKAFGYQCSVVIQRLIGEEELKESEEKHRNMIEISPDGIAASDLKGIVTSVNKSFLDITGYNKEEIVGKHVSKLPTISLKEFPKYMKIYKDILLGREKEPFVFRWKHKNGEMRWGECRYTIMKKEGEKAGVQVILRDITIERKHSEEIRKFKTISDRAKYGVILFELDGTTIYVNDAFAEMHGYKKEEIVGKPHDIFHIKENITTIVKDSLERLKKGEHILIEETHKKKDGTLIPVQINASPIPDDNGKTMLIAGIISDLTKQKELTQKLKESEKLFRTLIEQSSSGVYIHDPVKNKLFYANPLIRKILNIKEEEIEKTNLFDYIHPDDAALIKERTRKRLAGENIDPSVEVRIYPPGKKEMWVRLYTTFIKYKGTIAALASVIDITEGKKASLKVKEHLEELQKYKDATIGREMRVIELKKEVNKICKEQGLAVKYKDIEQKIEEQKSMEAVP